MAVTSGRLALAVVVALAIGIQQVLPIRPLITVVQLAYGIGKVIQPISDFAYQCRRIEHPLLQSCEDMWISEPTRKLYLACSDSNERLKWFPPVARYDLSGRSKGDNIVVVDLDQPALGTMSRSIVAQRLDTHGYSGTAGDGFLTLSGFTGVNMGNGVVRLLMPNNRPAIDPVTGTYAADQAAVGHNATVEVFEHKGDDGAVTHLLTLASPYVMTPNRVAAFGDKGFYLTNDHGDVKTGELARLRAMLLGKGDVTFCSYEKGCRTVSSGHFYPNGLLLHSDGWLYVPSSAGGGVQVYQPQNDGSLEKVGEVDIFYALDNLSEDRNGDIWAAAFPEARKNMAYVKSPFGAVPPATVLRIRRTGGGYEWDKVLEDRDGEVLPGATVVVHDATTGRLFLGSASSPFITVCDPQNA